MSGHDCNSFEKPDADNIFSAVVNGDVESVRRYVKDLGVDVN